MGSIEYIIIHYGFILGLISIILFLILLGIKIKKEALKNNFFNASALFIALLIYESYLAFITPNVEYIGSYFTTHKPIKDDILGYSQKGKNFNADYIKIVNGDTSIHVNYSIRNGKRVVGNLETDTSRIPIYFLGCSFTFGECLNDEETLPYLFHQKNKINYNTFNYGLHGYGPHQSLATIQSEIIKKHPIHKKGVAFYSFIPDHFKRAAGYAPWDEHGPFYEIQGDSLIYKGSFSSNLKFQKRNPLLKKLNIIWKNSNIYKSKIEPLQLNLKPHDIERVFLIIKKMHNGLKTKNIDFIIFIDPFYSTEDSNYSDLISYLSENKIPFIEGKNSMKITNENHAEYYIKGDVHPTKKYNQEVAELFSTYLGRKD